MITFVLLTFQGLFAQSITTNSYDIKTSLTSFHLNDKVKSILSTAIDAKGNLTTLPFTENEFYNQVKLEFNMNGNIVKRTNYLDYRNKLAVYSYIDYQYNKSNQIIEQKITVINNYEDPLRIASLKTFDYNSKGKILHLNEIVNSKTSSSNYQTEFIYNLSQLDQVIIKLNQVISSRNQFYYNKKGLLIKDETISFDGKRGMERTYVYDEQIPIYQEEEFADRKKITYYDSDNDIIKLQQFDQNKNLNLELVYNSQNNLVQAKVQTFIQGKPILNEYNLSYLLDKKGNWTTCQVSSQGAIQYYIHRTITYYS